MNSTIHQQQYQSTLSAYNEGMPFLQDEDAFYQHDMQQDDQEDLSNKKFQQGDDFRPTFYNPFEIKHRRRTSRAQFKVLEKTFLENPKPNAAVRRWLAQKLVMTPRGVQVWFQNRRAKEKSVNAKSTESANKNTSTTATTTAPQTASSSSSFSSFSPSSSVSSSPTPAIMTFSTTPTHQQDMYHSEPLIKDNSQYSGVYENTCIPSPPSTHSACACTDCSNVFATPMSRTMSYPPFYSDASCSAADEEELLMTPVTPFVDNQQQQYMFDPVFMNNRKSYQQQQQQDWLTSPNFLTQDINYYSTPNPMATNDIAVAAATAAMRRMYDDNNSMMFDNRRYSLPVNASQDRYIQSTELFRRLSEPIFDTELNLNDQFDLLPSTAL
ncbi:Homeodomain-like DNA binding domain-containing transcription factor [Mucor lusitanicus CBS 277.49]|uniref:Homeodomain-like DNA binding domain-containing transcription factor n=1 Tax=Mucor lusitanicus CBS 277.49 TaxID=747725 RepID=A0A168PL71_MUCCL|nr:Homeodomain-like DNA binding domain-containing transcription factor [Mucor lusitanicus CBS 277.49]